MPNFKPRNTARAQSLRNQAPPAERELWKQINRRQIAGAKFSRQMPVGSYFADFLCREYKFIIELDGYSHDLQQNYDRDRDAFMARQGYTVLRIANDAIFENLEGVVRQIEMALLDLQVKFPTPSPSRMREGN